MPEQFPVGGLARSEGDAAVAEQCGSDAVPTYRCEIGIPADLRIKMSVEINESRREDESPRVNHFAGAIDILVDFRDPTTVNREVRDEWLRAGAIHNGAAFDYDFM